MKHVAPNKYECDAIEFEKFIMAKQRLEEAKQEIEDVKYTNFALKTSYENSPSIQERFNVIISLLVNIKNLMKPKTKKNSKKRKK